MRTRVLVLAALAMLACHGKDDSEICNDGIDNDDNGLTDCADAACPQGTACGADGATCSAAQTCSATCTPSGAEQCGDGVDNDCDGLSDCRDSDCAASIACMAPAETCTDMDAEGRSVCLTATRVRLPADGLSTTDVKAVLRVSGATSPANAACVFSLSGAAAVLEGDTTPVQKKTDSAGRVSVLFGAGQNSGRATVLASCTPAGQATSVNATIAIELFGMGSMRVVSSEYDVLGARGSAYQEHTAITFQLLTEDGLPYPAGAVVNFTHQSQGGSFIGNVPTCDANVCTATARTDAEGKVRVLLTSGRTFAVLTVEAEASAGGVTAHGVAGGYPVVGAKANGAHISLDCRPYNVPAFTTHDCLYSHYMGEAKTVDCTVSLADRYGTVIGVPTLAAFQSEAGNVGPAAFTLAYDPTKPAAAQPALGEAVSFLSVYGHPLPRDVDPFPGEHNLPGSDFGCGTRTVNPRDGLVTVIAIVAGEEGFVDANLNGMYDAGEPFVDIGEPFVDANDDGQWNIGEWYEDVNANAAYDGPNGKWDSDTHLWTQARVLYTGYPHFAEDGALSYFSRFYLWPPSPPGPTAIAPEFNLLTPPDVTMETYGIFFTDARFNPLSAFTTYEVRTALGNAKATMIGPYGTADSLGTSFRLLYCDAKAPPRSCFYGPADSACRPASTANAACYVTPDVGDCVSGACAGFRYGNDGRVIVGCEKPGADAVTVTTDQEGVRHDMTIGGICTASAAP